MTAKISWIIKHFGEKWVERMILTRDKTLVYGDILIDDKPKITGLQTHPNFLHVFFDQPFNHNVDNYRITQWSKWPLVIAPILGAIGFLKKTIR